MEVNVCAPPPDNRADIGMIKGRGSLGLALESFQCLTILGRVFPEELQRRLLLSICWTLSLTIFPTSEAGRGLSTGNWMVPLDVA